MNREAFVERRRRVAGRPTEELLDLLESEDLATRFIAEMCLRDATGT